MLMSNNPIFSETDDILMGMRDSPHIFHLTGSRFFGNNELSSDWDFFIGYSESNPNELINWLVQSGFTSDDEQQYIKDGQCIRVYEFTEKFTGKYEEEKNYRATKIQVQIVESASIKNIVQSRLFEFYPKGTFTRDKKQARDIWKLAFSFLELGSSIEV